MLKRGLSEQKPVITATYGHYCGPWEWEGPQDDEKKYVKELMAERGYEMLLPDIPVSDPDITLDEQAKAIVAAEQERGAPEYVRWGHSFGGDLIYRELGSTPVSMLVFQASPLRPVLKRLGLPIPLGDQGIRYAAYVAAEIRGQVDFEGSREDLGEYMFSDLGSAALSGWATSKIQPHPHRINHTTDRNSSAENDKNAELPQTLPMHYVSFENDTIFHYPGQQLTARKLGLEFSSIRTCHFPMLEKPDLFVDCMIRLIEDRKAERRQALE
jgi:pimeloyl-ACP methyl ester carboxylesterase